MKYRYEDEPDMDATPPCGCNAATPVYDHWRPDEGTVYAKEARNILTEFEKASGDVTRDPPGTGLLEGRLSRGEITTECLDVLAWILFMEWSRLYRGYGGRNSHYLQFVEDIVARILRLHRYSGMHTREEIENADNRHG